MSWPAPLTLGVSTIKFSYIYIYIPVELFHVMLPVAVHKDMLGKHPFCKFPYVIRYACCWSALSNLSKVHEKPYKIMDVWLSSAMSTP